MPSTICETLRTATHVFSIYVYAGAANEFRVGYRSINPKTGEPWQSVKTVTDGATVEPKGWEGRPIAYPTIEAARAAMARQIVKLR